MAAGVSPNIHVHLQDPLRIESQLQNTQSPNFETFLEPRNRFQGINTASLCSRQAGTIILFHILGKLKRGILVRVA
jgi:hypothetical protein